MERENWADYRVTIKGQTFECRITARAPFNPFSDRPLYGAIRLVKKAEGFHPCAKAECHPFNWSASVDRANP